MGTGTGFNVVSHDLARRLRALHCWTGSHLLSRNTVTQHSTQLGSGSKPWGGKMVFGYRSLICIGSGTRVMCEEPHHYLYYDLGPRHVCGAGRWKLQPNSAPMPNMFILRRHAYMPVIIYKSLLYMYNHSHIIKTLLKILLYLLKNILNSFREVALLYKTNIFYKQ